MSKIWVPRDYQLALGQFALDNERVNLWAGTGTGKTSSILRVFDLLKAFGEANRLLVVSTKRVCLMVWPNEVKKWDNFRHLSVAVAVGTPAQRLAALQQGADITCINYDNLPWLMSVLGDDWPWDMVVADESTKLKSLRIDIRVSPKGKEYVRQPGGGNRAYEFAKASHRKIKRFYNMTGTPSPNGLQDLWGQQWFIDGGARLGRSFTAFENRYFKWQRFGADDFAGKLIPLPYADREIKSLLADCTMTIDAADFLDLPPLIRNVIPVRLPTAAYAKYRELEKEMFTEIERHEIEAFNAGAKSIKCRQLASGAAYIDEDDGSDTRPWVPVHDAKLEALEDIVSEAGGAPIIVAYQFKSDLARLKKAFPKGRYFDDKPATLAAFRRGEIPLLFIHPASAAHGIDGMQDVCNTVVWFSMTWNLEEFQQLIERVGPTRQVQSGHNRTVYCHILVGEKTVEEQMVERIDTKADVQTSLKNAMRHRG